MKKSTYKTYDELPLFLNADIVAKVLGISPSSAYELMHASSFPALRIGNRIVVPKEKFIAWVERNTADSSSASSTDSRSSTTDSHTSRSSANGSTGGLR